MRAGRYPREILHVAVKAKHQRKADFISALFFCCVYLFTSVFSCETLKVTSMWSTPPHPEKSVLRRTLRQQRAALTHTDRLRAELNAARQAVRKGYLRPGKRIAAYIPVGSEFSPWPLILMAMKRGVEVYLPQVPDHGRQMRFVRFDQHSHWGNGKHDIPEIIAGKACLPRQLDIVFLPLVGFDSNGTRLGQGGGYYDATFSFRRNRLHWKKPRLIGLAFSCQRVSDLPHDHWDLRLDAVLPANG